MLMINGLACLLIITSLCVIMVRTAKKAALFYSLQSLVLVLLFVYLANEMQAHELYMWSISAFITKVTLCYFVVVPIDLPLVAHLKPALSVSLSHFLLGLVCIVSQRNIVKQVFGYCLMENGSHLTLALLANKAPELVEIGIATDAIFAVIIMVVLVNKIYRTFHSLDAKQLMSLKG